MRKLPMLMMLGWAALLWRHSRTLRDAVLQVVIGVAHLVSLVSTSWIVAKLVRATQLITGQIVMVNRWWRKTLARRELATSAIFRAIIS